MEQFNGVQWLDESNTIQLVCTDGIQQWDTTIATCLKRWDAVIVRMQERITKICRYNEKQSNNETAQHFAFKI